MTWRDVAALQDRLTAHDLAVLDDIERFRLLTSQQLQRLHFATDRSAVAAARACNRTLTRLRQLRLVATLDRRIGGVRRGSAGLVWYLAPAGNRLQRVRYGRSPTRRRLGEPSRHFVHHTLAIAEAAVRVVEAARAGHFELLRIETEPHNWQPSMTSAGVATRLKPDLLLVTADGDFEQHWFIEIDLNTEHLPVIRRQCDAYLQHRSTGRYQTEHGVYPAVLWVAPSAARKRALARAIAASSAGEDDAFQTCTQDEFVAAVVGRPVTAPVAPGE